MKVEYINPFIEATVYVFRTMANANPVRGPVKLERGAFPSHDVSAIIGLSGETRGSLVLSMPRSVASRLVGQMLPPGSTLTDRDIADGVGEMANIISGNAKKQFSEMGYKVFISIPTVVVGHSQMIWRSEDMPRVSVAFTSEVGGFTVDVSLKMSKGEL